MQRLPLALLAGFACVTTLSLDVPVGRAQTGANPLIGAWSFQMPDGNGGVNFVTVLYKPDGSFSTTMRVSSGMVNRTYGHFQAQMTGGNQMRVSRQVEGLLPEQVCSSSGQCTPSPMPSTGVATFTVTFNGPNMLTEDGGISEMRDPSFGLAQIEVPAVFVVPVVNPTSQLCTVGVRQCFSGYMRTCQIMPNGTGSWWITSSQTC